MAKLQIQIMSDLHLENPKAYDIYPLEAKAPSLALLGDIGQVKDTGFFDFLRAQLSQFRHVFFLFGNHEPYESDWKTVKRKVLEFEDDVQTEFKTGKLKGELIVLDQTRYDLSPDVTILGCTLFSRILPAQEDNVSFGLNDFYSIKDWTTEAHSAAHALDLTWLNTEAERISDLEPHRRIVIFTHYSPSIDPRSSDPKHANSSISSGFSTDLTNEPCWLNTNVQTWVFGHTHFNCDFVEESTKKHVLANQRGYYFAQADGFDKNKVVSV